MFKSIGVLCLLLNGFISFSQPIIDVQHYKYEIELSDLSDSIKAKATITVKFLQTADKVAFDFTTTNKGRVNMLVNVSMADPSQKATLISTDKNKLGISLNAPINVGTEATFIIDYAGVPFDGLIISKNKYGQRTFFSDNWPDRAHTWIPCIDELTDKASVEFLVTAPSHYQVVSNGILVEETNLPGNKKITHWREDISLPTKVMVIGAADFAVNYPGEVNCVPLSSWVFPGNRNDGFYDYAGAIEVLTFLSEYIGPYPFKKLANVQSLTIFGGMENASAIFYAESAISGHRDHLELLAHEITHQWFGNMATEKSFAHLWLSEGFATYLAELYIWKKFGADSARAMRRVDRQQVIDFVQTFNKPVVDSSSTFMELLNANSYQKGGWILHMLREQLGDAVFQKAVQTYYATYTGKNAETRDLQKVFEKVSGKDLSIFFKQWLYTPGIPKLDIKWKYLVKEQKLQVTVKQLQKSVYQFPLEISFGKSQIETARVNQQTQTFIFSAKEKPSEVLLDPQVNLLFEGNVAETK